MHAVHEKHRDHLCPHCDKISAFAQAINLKMHVCMVHEKRKDHACPHCDAAFGTASSLTRHVRAVHEKRKDHACSQAPLYSRKQAT